LIFNKLTGKETLEVLCVRQQSIYESFVTHKTSSISVFRLIYWKSIILQLLKNGLRFFPEL